MEVPLAGHDYPGRLREFNAWFRDDEACLRYLAGLRWQGGFVCAVCGGERAWRMSKGRSSRQRGLLFYRLLEQATQIDHAPVAAITGGRR